MPPSPMLVRFLGNQTTVLDLVMARGPAPDRREKTANALEEWDKAWRKKLHPGTYVPSQSLPDNPHSLPHATLLNRSHCLWTVWQENDLGLAGASLQY